VKRALVLLICACALATACGSSHANEPAATVNGVTVKTQDVVDELNAITANQDYLKSIDQLFKQSGQSVVGTKPGTYDAGFVAQVVRRQMQFALIHSEVEKRGLQANADCKATAKNDIISSLGQGDMQQGQTVFDSFPDTYRNQLEAWYDDQYVLQADLVNQPCGSAEVAKAYFDAHPDDFTGYCVSLISVNDETLANNIVSESRSGGDFAALAQQNSTDAQTAAAGGDAGCHQLSEFPQTISPTVQSTPIGGITDPISDNAGGFVIIKLTDKKPATFTDSTVQSQAQGLATRDQSVELGSWLQKAYPTSQVAVDPRYGTFDQSTFTITAPGASTTTSSPDQSNPPTSDTAPSDQPPTAGP
jgi:parvulin-like peptidyl-prolyl isomerase